MLYHLTGVCGSVNSNGIKKVHGLGLFLFLALPCHGYTQGKMVWAQSITECFLFCRPNRLPPATRHNHQQASVAPPGSGGGGMG
jgi:hypothetical protein